MTSAPESLPSDLVAAHAMILAERAARREAEAKLANAGGESTKNPGPDDPELWRGLGGVGAITIKKPVGGSLFLCSGLSDRSFG